MEIKADLFLLAPSVVCAYSRAVNRCDDRGICKWPRVGSSRYLREWIWSTGHDWRRLLYIDRPKSIHPSTDKYCFTFPSSHRRILGLLGEFIMEDLGVEYFFYRRSKRVFERLSEVETCVRDGGMRALEVFLKGNSGR
jgi:hypothetical protein